MKNTIFLFTSLLLSLLLYAGDFDITQYGAVGDGKTLNTAFIQKAIDECNKSGGGKVIFPAGINSKMIRVKKNKTKGIKKIVDQPADLKSVVAVN